jgi:hypothetical protein
VQATGSEAGQDIGSPVSARYMMLYSAQDIQASGMIHSLSFKRYTDTASVSCSGVTVKIGHTSVGDLSSTFLNNVEQGKGKFTTVINNTSINVPAGLAGEYFEITLTQPFNYNGVDNLVVEVARTDGCSAIVPVTYHDSTYDGLNVNASGATLPTGTVTSVAVDARFNFAGGDNVAVGLSGGGSNYTPFLDTPGSNQKVQLLYTAGEINGSGSITGIALPVGITTTEGTYTINVRLGHTTLSQLTDTFANNFNTGSPVTMASGANFSVPAGVPVDSYIWIPMPDATFNYNGTNNLIVEVEVTSASGGWVAWKTNNTAVTARRLPAAVGATTGTPDNAYYCIKFRFAGGTMGVITAENTSLTFPYDATNANKQQFLYRASELGTKGSITRVAYRLLTDSVTSTYGSFEVVLGHTANSTLGNAFFSANMTGAQTVYSGTFTIPAGLKAGDWIEIPLSTPFAYNGESNLVVQTSNLDGTADNQILAEPNGTLYPYRRAYLIPNTGDVPSGHDNTLADLRLELQ